LERLGFGDEAKTKESLQSRLTVRGYGWYMVLRQSNFIQSANWIANIHVSPPCWW